MVFARPFGALKPIKKIGYIQFVILFTLATMLSTFGAVITSRAKAHADTVETGATQVVVSGDDEASDPIDLPFDFHFYDQDFSQLQLTTNGVISFSDVDSEYDNTDLSKSDLGNYSIYAFWDDLNNDEPIYLNNIYYKTIGTSGEQQFIIQYTNHRTLGHVSNMPFTSFQIILNEADNSIQLQYDNILLGDVGKGSEATIGISDGQGHFSQYSYNQPSLSNRKAIKYTPTSDTNYAQEDNATYQPVILAADGQAATPTITSIDDETTDVAYDVNPTFSWEDSSSTNDYQFFLSDDPQFIEDSIILNQNVNSDSLELSSDSWLQSGKTYYWFVESLDSGSMTSAITPVYSFTTVARPSHDITNCDDLVNMGDVGTASDEFKLTANIDCSSVLDFQPIGTSGGEWDGTFSGVLDGQGHSITNLNITSEDDQTGLFKHTENATIKDLTIESGSITSTNSNTGAFVGWSENTSYYNLTNNATVTGTDAVGGIAGYSRIYGDFVEDASRLVNTADINAENDGGGLFGGVEVYGNDYNAVNYSLKQSYNIGSISSSDSDAGGLMGWYYIENYGNDKQNLTFYVEDVYNRGTVSSVNYAGGIVGWAQVTNYETDAGVRSVHKRSYSSGDVTATNDAGGIIGHVDTFAPSEPEISIFDNFVTSKVTADNGGYAVVGSDGYRDDNGNLDLENNIVDQTASGHDSGVYFPTDNFTFVNVDGDDNSHFVNTTSARPFVDDNQENPQQVWDFDNVWVSHRHELPTLRAFGGDDIVANHSSIDFTSPVNGAFMQLNQSGCEEFETAAPYKESQLSVKDAGYDYPTGLLGFKAIGCSSSAFITLVVVGKYNPKDLTIRKYNSNDKSFTNLTSSNSGLTVSKIDHEGKQAIRVQYTVEDNGPLDQDNVSGTITDPVGLATLAVESPNTGLQKQ